MQRRTLLPDRLAGGIWGHLVGDAVGVPYEFRPASAIGEVRFGATGTHQQPPGTWSDDGALMLALLDSLLSAGFDVEDQGRRALAWADDGAYTPDGNGRFDIGGATSAALDRIRRGQAAATAGGTGESDLGNGSLMRVPPVALVDADVDDDELVERAHAASAVTHGHPVAQAACALYVLVARGLLTGEDGRQQALDRARRTLRALYGASADRTAALDRLEAWTGRSGRGFVVDSFWSAWDAFAGADSYEETIVRAIRYGNDTDTTAAIAGGLAGLRWGLEGIPTGWLTGMRGRDVVGQLVDRLVQTAGWKTSSGNPLRVDWVDLSLTPRFGSSPGRLGMTFLPGKQRDGWSGRHWRDLEADATRLRGTYGADVLLLLVEDGELEAARVPMIGDALAKAGVEVIRFPIRDNDAPNDRDALRELLDRVIGRLKAGSRVVVACRGGLGRTGTMVGCLLRDSGLSGADAIRLTRRARPNAIENRRQEGFVRAWDWPDRSTQPESGYLEMLAAFRSADLPEPPIPAPLRTALRLVRDWCWSTRPIDPMEMYMFREYPAEVVSAEVGDYVAVSHAGHGVTSCAVSLHVVYGPMALFVQTLWGGVYSDNEEQARLLDVQFRKVADLIEAVDASSSEIRFGSRRLVVGQSQFRMAAYCGIAPESHEGRRGWFERHRLDDFDPLSVALGWIRSAEVGS